MNTRTTMRNRLWIAAVVLPVATLLLFGWSGGLTDPGAWTSGVAAGSALAAVLVFAGSAVHRRQMASSPGPFTIALGFIVGVYAVSVLLEILLLGYLFKLPEKAYFNIHAMTLLGFGIVFALVAMIGKYIVAQEETELGHVSRKQETVVWIGSIRSKLSQISDDSIRSLDREMEELEETLRYSDPIPHASLHEAEHLIRDKIALLEDQIALIGAARGEARQQAAEEASRMIADVLRTVQDRNTQLLKAKAGST